jgi:uncharacterized phage-associated protein
MFHLGKTRGQEPLVPESFEAWDYGPVLPSLYHDLKMFGRKPVRNAFWTPPVADGTEEAASIDGIAEIVKSLTPSALVGFTHDPRGAWAKHYHAGAKGVTIPNSDILEEYDWRPKRAA